MSSMNVLALQMPGAFEWILIAGLGLLIFGKRLPEVGRSLGRGIVEFKRGLQGVDDDLSGKDQPALPGGQAKFDPYTGKPVSSESGTGRS